MTIANSASRVSYEQFREEWLADIVDADQSPLDKGRSFATKLITQWLDVTTDDEDFVVCDGSGDGGIDVAYLRRADSDTGRPDENSEEGDVWYLVQSKYGASFTGMDTILQEGNKVIRTLQGKNKRLSQDSKQLLKKIDGFLKKASKADRIVLVFATTDPISQQERDTLDNIRLIGRERIAKIFDVEEVSLQTIWQGLDNVDKTRLSVAIDGQFVEQMSGLLVGTISLLNLFTFMSAYKHHTGDLNQLYEKNVRQFLGSRRKINKGIARTLQENPEKFGLYNNGITIVVSGYSRSANGVYTVRDPYIVNGCQTTKTIWEVLEPRINSGGTGSDSASVDWNERIQRGGVVTKIVRSDEAEITNITRFTNAQNAVREQDFIALNSGFQNWAAQMASEYQVYLEIQRGGVAARKAWEKQHPDQPKFADYVNAFDLIKVYGAGWISAPGMAFGKNAPFLPGGSVYERIIEREKVEPAFGARDLYAAYKIKSLADEIGFGRGTKLPSRRQSRFLFYYVIMSMLRNIVVLTPELEMPAALPSDLTDSVLTLAVPGHEGQLDKLTKAAVGLVDRYLTPGASENDAFNETSFLEIYNGDLNAFLKAENLGKGNHSPKLAQSLAITNEAFGMSDGRERVAKALMAASG